MFCVRSTRRSNQRPLLVLKGWRMSRRLHNREPKRKRTPPRNELMPRRPAPASRREQRRSRLAQQWRPASSEPLSAAGSAVRERASEATYTREGHRRRRSHPVERYGRVRGGGVPEKRPARSQPAAPTGRSTAAPGLTHAHSRPDGIEPVGDSFSAQQLSVSVSSPHAAGYLARGPAHRPNPYCGPVTWGTCADVSTRHADPTAETYGQPLGPRASTIAREGPREMRVAGAFSHSGRS